MQETEHIELTWLRLHVGKFLTSPDCNRMDTDEFGAFVLLLFSSFFEKKRGYLKNNDEILRKITRLSTSKWKKKKEFILSKFKVDKDGDLYNEKWLAEIRDAEQCVSKNKARTQPARQARFGFKPTINGQTYSDTIKTSEWSNVDEYMEYRELEYSKLDEQFIQALKDKIGIDRPIVWCNKKIPTGYFDLIDCIYKMKEDVEWQSSVMQNNTLSKTALLQRIYEFVKEIKDSKVYMSYDGYDSSDGKENFIKHFVYWLKLKNNK